MSSAVASTGIDHTTRSRRQLPPTSGYTYAVELSVDEAMAAGAKSVAFSMPVPVYVENFLNFPIGDLVPVGVYDREKGAWMLVSPTAIFGTIGGGQLEFMAIDKARQVLGYDTHFVSDGS